MIALISDIHGNYAALREVLSAIDHLKIERIYCLGDVVGYYPQVNECCDALRLRNIPCVLGNHDWHMISNTICKRSKSANDCLKYQREILSSENKNWLASFPVYKGIDNLAIVHGGWENPIDEYLLNPEQKYFDSLPNNYFASGHTHKQLMKSFGDKSYCNPGSVGQPRDGDYRAACATFDGEKFKLMRVDYDVSEVCKLMEKMGFNRYYYDRLNSGAEHFGEIN